MPHLPAAPDPAVVADRDQCTVLRFLLELHPAQLTIEELVRELTIASDEFSQTDPIEQAVRSLVATGLLNLRGDYLIPTRPAVRFNQLIDTPGAG
jgi:hypothetical protein